MQLSEGGLSILQEMLCRALRCNSYKEIKSSRRRDPRSMGDSCSAYTQPVTSRYTLT